MNAPYEDFEKFSGGSQPAGIKKKSKRSGSSHSARIPVKTQAEPTGMSYKKTAYVGITKKVLSDGSVRYRVMRGKEYVASGKMTFAEALNHKKTTSGCQIQKCPTRGCKHLG